MDQVQVEPGSFRDRDGRVFYLEERVLRTLSPKALDDWKALSSTRFFQQFLDLGKIVPTRMVEDTSDLLHKGEWAGLLEHEKIPCVSYPYEWSFAMLKDAALLQLELAEAALQEGLLPKDASSFNIQWRGTSPVFIDVLSFERVPPGTPWAGYRQFCQLFLYPLFLQAYKGVDFHSWLRGCLNGLDPVAFSRILSWRDLLRPGVFKHVCLQSKLQQRMSDAKSDLRKEMQSAGFGKEMVQANLRGLRRLTEGLSWKETRSTWSDYTEIHTYSDSDGARKSGFVDSAAESIKPSVVWDLGSNTGVFSRIVSHHADYVVAMDGDHLAVERLYCEAKKQGNRKILPLVVNLTDPSPNLGWRNQERKRLDERSAPDLVLCLALIHHVVIGGNVPVTEFVDWLRSLGSHLVIEFVTKQDPMVRKLLLNKEDQYEDYELNPFESCLKSHFRVIRREALSNGTRFLYWAEPA